MPQRIAPITARTTNTCNAGWLTRNPWPPKSPLRDHSAFTYSRSLPHPMSLRYFEFQ